MEGMNDKIRKLIESELKETPTKISHMSFGHGSKTYEVELSDKSVILRTNTKASAYVGTAKNIRELGGLGLPVPRIISESTDPTEYGFVYMILEKIPGRDLRFELASMSKQQIEVVAKQVAGFELLVESLPAEGYGYAPIGQRGRYDSWTEFLRAQLGVRTPADEYTALLKNKLGDLVDRLEPELLRVKSTCFLDDLTTKNVIIENGTLRGVIDFDVVCYGDPLWWLSLTGIAVLADLGREHFYYAEELRRIWGVDRDTRRRLALYENLHALDFMIRAKEGPDWVARMHDYVDNNLALISQKA